MIPQHPQRPPIPHVGEAGVTPATGEARPLPSCLPWLKIMPKWLFFIFTVAQNGARADKIRNWCDMEDVIAEKRIFYLKIIIFNDFLDM